ncbi:uncharacterized protein E0L32_005781 [Thyridium curvatum]|uniref:Uncharacterized protein n=1 Tax=Thyridium curvatum TaxID=1093900 RepID=A0A507B278_9PEZI|nr:uncharacterized protein E0L32_005781 [Thyridium curvatum]TPX13837.1 hypothetical protein E0L32_005781 [Thyridium curvatum]
MRPPASHFLLLLSALAEGALAAPDADKTTPVAPCTASSTSGAFFDLSPDMAVAPAEGAKPKKGVPSTDYHARGHDYGYNFTLNICAAVVDPVKDVIGIEKADWRNVSAYYESKGKVFSLGQQTSVLKPRGRELVLQYTGGSPCGPVEDDSFALAKRRSTIHDGASYKSYQDDDDDLKSPKSKGVTASKSKSKRQRKSATFSLICDRESLNNFATVSFVGADPNECAYFFKVRSIHACAGAEPHKPGSVGPGGVFAIILFIAVLVYIIGGIFYQRTVAHARGWRQLPNYSLWAGIWSFIHDTFIILTSSCARMLPSRRGYHSVSRSPNGRSRNRDDENRLIDSLDEEWDD